MKLVDCSLVGQGLDSTLNIPRFPRPATPRSASPGRCFSGSGSGSWASLAYAIGRGGAALVYLGTIPAPSGWGLVRVAGSAGWYRFQSPQIQLGLF